MLEPFDAEREAQTEMVFEAPDLDLLNLAVKWVPELCIATWAAKRRRELGLGYPFAGPDDLLKLLAGKDFLGGGYRIRPEDVARYVPAVFFPISSDEDLIGKVRISLVRASQEHSIAKSQTIGWGFMMEGGK